MRMMPRLPSLLAALFLGLALPLCGQAGELYKWTDENGKVQYTQFPPKNRPYTTMTITGVKAPAPQAPAAAAPALATEEAAKEEGGKAAKGKAKTDDQSSQFLASKKSNCDVAKKNQETLTSKSRISFKDKDGKTRLMTDQERADQLKLADEQIKTYCH